MRKLIRDEAIEKESMFWLIKLQNFFGTDAHQVWCVYFYADSSVCPTRQKLGTIPTTSGSALVLRRWERDGTRASQKTLRKGALRQANCVVEEYPSRNSPAYISDTDLNTNYHFHFIFSYLFSLNGNFDNLVTYQILLIIYSKGFETNRFLNWNRSWYTRKRIVVSKSVGLWVRLSKEAKKSISFYVSAMCLHLTKLWRTCCQGNKGPIN